MTDEGAKQQLTKRQRREKKHLSPPPGFKLRSTLRGHGDIIWQIAWAPDGRTLASGSDDKTIRLWDVEAARVSHTLTGHTNKVYRVA